jgi:hypothetical protein
VSRLALVLAAGCVLAGAGTAPAAEAGKVQPDGLPFGTLYTDGIAEGSFMLFAPGDEPNPKITVDAPKFVKVLNTGTHRQEFGNRGAFTCVTVEVAIDTAKAGEFKGEIALAAGETKAKVPVSATVKARTAGTPRVLIVGSPFERYSTTSGSHYKGWTDVVDAAGLDVSYLLVRPKTSVVRDTDLGKFDCVLMSADALHGQTKEDVKRVRAFAEGGGRLVVTANAFFVSSVKGANAVLDGYGLEMKDTEAPMAVEVVVKKDHLDPELVKAGVGKVKFFRASPVQADRGKGGRVLISTPEFDQPGYGYVAIAKAGKGEVVAMGVSLWWSWVSDKRANESDNGKVLGHLLAPPRKG